VRAAGGRNIVAPWRRQGEQIAVRPKKERMQMNPLTQLDGQRILVPDSK
jgi:hypothetical protein